jgi:hypothetical protein
MDKLSQVKTALAVYAEENNIPDQAVNLMEVLVVNNVSYEDADQFCADHFITTVVADYYKNFYTDYAERVAKEAEQMQEVSDNQIDPKVVLHEIRDKIDFLLTIL